MCGRYYMDAGIRTEIKEVVPDIDQKFLGKYIIGDIRPNEMAPVIEMTDSGLKVGMCRWGYPISKGKNLVINARVESVMDRLAFRNGILYHRILIPASGFYEWNQLKEKSTFTREDASILYFAGIYDWIENERRFVILTTAANESMKKVHDRMPLILEQRQIEQWFDDEQMKNLHHQVPVELKRKTEYEQQSLCLDF